MADRLDRGLQQNLITLLLFHEIESKIVRNSVEIRLFEGVYADIAQAAYTYIDQYDTPPKEHIADELSEILEGDDKRKKKLYGDILSECREFSSLIQPQYVLTKLEIFVRRQKLKTAIVETADKITSGDEVDLQDAEETLLSVLRAPLEGFAPGLRLSDASRSLSFFDQDAECFPTGVSQLDYYGIGPIRKGLNLFVALPERGKTMWLVNLAKHAIMQRLKVFHVTLEMSEERMSQRYMQNLFAVPKRQGEILQTIFERDVDGKYKSLDREEIIPKLALGDDDAREKLEIKINQVKRYLDRVIIKEFPTGRLTIRELEAYLDMLEIRDGFVPDLLIVDYADLMTVKSENYRHDLGKVYQDLRGIAVDRNLAVATASQSNREGLKSKLINEGNIAEDFSKIAIADSVITYTQTDEEKSLGLARLFVAKSRNDMGRFSILISQNYAIGQFVLDSTMFNATASMENYMENVGDILEDEV